MNIFWLVFLGLFLNSMSLLADTDLIAGKDYTIIAPPSVKEPLVEKFFNYACPACRQLDSFITQMKDNHPKLNIELKPVSFNQSWEIYTRAYLIGEKLNVLEKSHHRIFHLLHVEKKPFKNEADMKRFFVSLGIKEKAYDDIANSYWLDTQVRLSKQYAFKHKIKNVPTLIINKRYQLDLKALKVTTQVEKAIVELSGLNNEEIN